jgi:hypothetical protein
MVADATGEVALRGRIYRVAPIGRPRRRSVVGCTAWWRLLAIRMQQGRHPERLILLGSIDTGVVKIRAFG